MTTRTALEIAIELDAASCSSFVKLEAAEALRKQQAEVERLTKQNAAYRTLNSAQSKQLEFHRSKDAEYQEAIATIDSERAANEMLTAERDAAIAAAVLAEREACAVVCENGNFLHDAAPTAIFGKECARAIRARSAT